MTKLGARLSRDLQQIAEHAVVSDSAWAQIRHRIDEGADQSEVEVIAFDADAPFDHNGGSRLALAMMGAAAAVVLAAVAFWAVRPAANSEPVPAAAEAERVVADYVDAFNRGDVEAAIELFAADATLPFRRDSAGSGHDMTVGEWGLVVEFYSAQQARISDVDCQPVVTAAVSTTLRCGWRLHDAVTEAAGQPGEPVEAVFTVADDLIVALDEEGEEPSPARRSFVEWVLIFHPDDDELFVWPRDVSAAEARRLGERATTLAAEWADQAG